MLLAVRQEKDRREGRAGLRLIWETFKLASSKAHTGAEFLRYLEQRKEAIRCSP